MNANPLSYNIYCVYIGVEPTPPTPPLATALLKTCLYIIYCNFVVVEYYNISARSKYFCSSGTLTKSFVYAAHLIIYIRRDLYIACEYNSPPSLLGR